MTSEEIMLVIVIIVLGYFVSRSLTLERKIKSLQENLAKIYQKKNTDKIELKRRKRYIVFHIVSNQSLTRVEEVNNIITSSLRSCGGDLMLGECKPQVIYFSSRRSRGILRTYHDCYEKIIACLSTTRGHGDKKILFIPIRTTGTLKKARWYLFDKKITR